MILRPSFETGLEKQRRSYEEGKSGWASILSFLVKSIVKLWRVFSYGIGPAAFLEPRYELGTWTMILNISSV